MQLAQPHPLAECSSYSNSALRSHTDALDPGSRIALTMSLTSTFAPLSSSIRRAPTCPANADANTGARPCCASTSSRTTSERHTTMAGCQVRPSAHPTAHPDNALTTPGKSKRAPASSKRCTCAVSPSLAASTSACPMEPGHEGSAAIASVARLQPSATRAQCHASCKYASSTAATAHSGHLSWRQRALRLTSCGRTWPRACASLGSSADGTRAWP